jgi:hypothetical protein
MMRKWSTTFYVGVYRCDMTFVPERGIRATWTPHMPRKLSQQQWAQYQAGRDALLAEVGVDLGGPVLVIEE